MLAVLTLSLALHALSPSALRPAAPAVRLARLPHPIACATEGSAATEPAATATPPSGDSDRGLTGEVISYDSLSSDMQALVQVALKERNRERLMSDKPKYDNLQAMIDEYEKAGGAKFGWSRAEAESEVVRFLQRRAMKTEGGLDGDIQDKVNFAFLALLLSLVAYRLGVASDVPLFVD